MSAPAVDGRALRAVLGHFPTGVTVVTTRTARGVHGATVNAFTSVSVDPALVLVALDRRSRSCEHVGREPFVINLLAESQQPLALHFAGRPGPDPIEWLDADTDFPRLAGTVGHISCRPWASYDGGDHLLHVGEVHDFDVRSGPPLLFFRGAFPRLEPDPTVTPWFETLDGPAAVRHHQEPHADPGGSR